MNDYFSALLCDNTADIFEFGFASKKSEERKNNNETDRVNFYNKQNLLASECSERLYERNAEIDRLVAKFDANIEDIWKSSSESDHLRKVKYQTLFSQNFFSNPHFQFEPDIVWSFEQNKKDEKNTGIRADGKGNSPGYKSFCQWNKFASPILQNSYEDLETVLSGVDVTLSNTKKWSAMDGHNNVPNPPSKQNSYTEVVLPKIVDASLNQICDLENEISGVDQNCQEEEDLLTSAKTHFRPIRTEELGSSQTGIYADGTTFAIPNDLEKVSFKRSDSGLLYLEVDADTPRKYMEFKEKEIGGNKGDWESDVSSLEEFVPKFRLRQSNEKCIQTDEIDEEQIVPSVNDTDCESVSCKSEEDEFYFPGDDELAQNIINAIEDEYDNNTEKMNFDCDYKGNKLDILEMSLYKMAELKSCICGGVQDWNQNLKEDSCKKKEWSQIWDTQMTCESCQSNSDKLSTKDKFRFREELTQEGEQLLLDLSCLQQMYLNSDWCDDESIIGSDLNDDEARNSEEEIPNDGFLTSEMSYPGKGAWWSMLIAKEEPLKNGFDLRCLWKEEKLFSDLSENDKNKLNENTARPFVADLRQAERKR